MIEQGSKGVFRMRNLEVVIRERLNRTSKAAGVVSVKPTQARVRYALAVQSEYNTPAQNRASRSGRGRSAMNDPFEKKVRAAAVAGWWVLLIGYGLLTLTWAVYLALVSARPAWMPALWGQDVSWDFMQTVSLWFLGVFKLFLWFVILVVLWLTLLAWQLRKSKLRRRIEPGRSRTEQGVGLCQG